MIPIGRRHVARLALIALLAVAPDPGLAVGGRKVVQRPPSRAAIHWSHDSGRSLDEALAKLTAPKTRSADPVYFGAFGDIGISHAAATREQLIEFAEELARDKGFRELVVRHMSEEDCGVQFVYTGTDIDHSMVRDLINKFRKRFGRTSVFLVNISSVSTDEPGHRALGIVTFRPLE